MILYINGCVREDSRTQRIAEAFLAGQGEPYTELVLSEMGLEPLSAIRLKKRTDLIEKGKLGDPEFSLARQFAGADRIVISAPYWDLSFPSYVKLYIENIYITGIVSRYDENGMPVGLCRARDLTYITTAGGPYIEDYSFGYLKDLAENFFGIRKTRLIKAEMLDVIGFDAAKIVEDTIAGIKRGEY